MVKVNDNGQEKPNEQREEEHMLSNKEEDIEASASQPKQVTVTDVELKHLQREMMEYKDKYLRLLADAENTRKRMQKERQEFTKYAVENVIVDFLYPIDNLENALKFAQQMSDEVKHWAFGFQMILTQFKDVLTNNGVIPFESQGMKFDPHAHEAVEIVETTTQPPGTIMEEYVRGYKIGDRTIRPARVKVAKGIQEMLVEEKQPQKEKRENNQNKD